MVPRDVGFDLSLPIYLRLYGAVRFRGSIDDDAFGGEVVGGSLRVINKGKHAACQPPKAEQKDGLRNNVWARGTVTSNNARKSSWPEEDPAAASFLLSFSTLLSMVHEDGRASTTKQASSFMGRGEGIVEGVYDLATGEERRTCCTRVGDGVQGYMHTL